jgi:hypothetical protein
MLQWRRRDEDRGGAFGVRGRGLQHMWVWSYLHAAKSLGKTTAWKFDRGRVREGLIEHTRHTQ